MWAASHALVVGDALKPCDCLGQGGRGRFHCASRATVFWIGGSITCERGLVAGVRGGNLPALDNELDYKVL